MPWRYWRMSTTWSSAVSATTLTHGGCSLIQYFGMTVPLGSCDAVDAHRVPGLARQVLAGEHAPNAGIVVERHRRRMLLLVRTLKGFRTSRDELRRQSPAPLYAIPNNARARRNTDRIMSGVSFLVFVFWRLGW